MPEPHATGAASGYLFLKLGGAALLGLAGAAVIAGFAPKKIDRAQLFKQVAAGGVASLFFGPAAVNLVDHYLLEFVDLAKLPGEEAIIWAAPVLFFVGAMGWGVFGAFYKFRELLAERAAHKAADLLQMGEPKIGPGK